MFVQTTDAETKPNAYYKTAAEYTGQTDRLTAVPVKNDASRGRGHSRNPA